MGGLRQRGVWPPAPAAVRANGDAPDLLLRRTADAVVNNNHVVRHTGAAQHRTRIVGAVAVIDRPGDLADVIGDDRCGWRGRRVRINHDGDRLGWRTFVARAVLIGDRQGDIVRAVWQRLSRRPAPCSVLLNGNHIGLFDAINVDRDRIARRTGAA
ncbi:hypothetical protein D3C72_671810 [compost metagenome]